MKVVMSLLLVLPLLLLFSGVAFAQNILVDDVATELVCQCGCGSVLNACVHQECASRTAMLASISQQISASKSKEEIIQGFVRQYGEQVLSAPTKKGFNLTAWITPFVALAAGALLLYSLLRLWVSRGKEPVVVASTPKAQANNDKYRQRLEQELEEFGREGRA